MPAGAATFTVTGTLVHPDNGVPLRTGRVEYEYPYPIQVGPSHTTVTPGIVAAKITNGVYTTPPLIDPNDPAISPQGFPYTVRIVSPTWTPPAYRILIPPGSAGQVLHHDDLAPAVDLPALVVYALASQLAAYLTKAILTAKGDLYAATGAGAPARLGIGGNGQVLTADSAAATGLKWADAGAATVSSVNTQTGAVELDAADVGAAPTVHTHTTGDVTGLAAYVVAAVAAVVDTAPSALDTLNELAAALGDDPAFATTITNLIGTKVPLSLIDAAGDLLVGSAADTAVRLAKGSNGQVLGVTGGAVGWTDPAAGSSLVVAQRRITSGNVDPLPNTAGAWVPLAGFEISIPAAVGDWLRLSIRAMRTEGSSGAFMDFAVLTGAGPSIARYLSNGLSTPCVEGDPAFYFSGGYLYQTAPIGLRVEASDIDAGQVRIGVVVKASGSGKLYGSPDFPFNWFLENAGAAGAA